MQQALRGGRAAGGWRQVEAAAAVTPTRAGPQACLPGPDHEPRVAQGERSGCEQPGGGPKRVTWGGLSRSGCRCHRGSVRSQRMARLSVVGWKREWGPTCMGALCPGVRCGKPCWLGHIFSGTCTARPCSRAARQPPRCASQATRPPCSRLRCLLLLVARSACPRSANCITGNAMHALAPATNPAAAAAACRTSSCWKLRAPSC